MAKARKPIKDEVAVHKFSVIKTHLCDLILASEPEDSEIHKRTLELRARIDDVIAEYAKR